MNIYKLLFYSKLELVSWHFDIEFRKLLFYNELPFFVQQSLKELIL